MWAMVFLKKGESGNEDAKISHLMRRLPLLAGFLVTGAAILFLAFSIFKKSPVSLSMIFQSWGVGMESSSKFTVNSQKREDVNETRVYFVKAQADSMRLHVQRITGLAEAEAMSYIDARKTRILSFYEYQNAPYPGFLTKIIECPEEFKPVIREIFENDLSITTLILFSNERLSYGICSDDLAKFRTIIEFVYCKEKKDLFSLNFSVPKKEFNEQHEEMLGSFKCIH